MFHRLSKPAQGHSFFLFGPRGTGKSTLLKTCFSQEQPLFIDLLEEDLFDRYSRRPQVLESEILGLNPKPKLVIIDEIQKIPRLLNVVHRLIEKDGIVFGLTGSSARKLKRGASNLLAGRAFLNYLFPLTSIELGAAFHLPDVLTWGSLPKIFGLQDPHDKEKFLKTYALTYLREELMAEQIIRKLEPFREFLEISAQHNGKVINFSAIANDVGVDTKTVQSYFQVLEDTLVGFHLPSYDRSVRKSQRQNPKFYWFDIGVKRALERTLDIPPNPRTAFYGECFEHFVLLEFFRMNHYSGKDYRLSYFQTYGGGEIDLILSRSRRNPILIEIKSAETIVEEWAVKLAKLGKEFKTDQMFILSQDPVAKKMDSVRCVHWKLGIQELFGE